MDYKRALVIISSIRDKFLRRVLLYMVLLVYCTALEEAVNAGGVASIAHKGVNEKDGISRIEDVLSEIEDEELKDFIKALLLTGRNPYPDVVLDIWLVKAIEESKHALVIVKFLASKGMISKSLGWFATADPKFSVGFPMHRAAYLGKVKIVKYLLEQGVSKYDPNTIFMMALKGTYPAMVRLLLKKGIFDQEKLYGAFPSIMPQVILALFVGSAAPVGIWALKKYRAMTFHPWVDKYHLAVSLAVACLILIYLFLNIPHEPTEGLGYLHLLATLSIDGDVHGVKARNIVEIAKFLLKEGANINQRGGYIHELGVDDVKKIEGFTALHAAIKRGNILLVKLLVTYGADVNALLVLKSFDRESAMSGLDGNDLVVYLPFLGGKEGRVLAISTPLDYARAQKQKTIYHYLKHLEGRRQAKHYKDLFNFLA